MADSTRSMRRQASALLLAALVLLALPAIAIADHHEGEGGHSHDQGDGGTDLAVVLMGDYDRASSRFVDLASAIPADHYGWRPAEGVRSVSETLMHVAAANWGISQSLGMEPERGAMTREQLEGLEKEITGRDEALEELKTSIAFAKETIEEAVGKDPNEMIPVFGSELPRSQVLIILDTHMHEHLGQLIAYARSNGVVPPWSQ